MGGAVSEDQRVSIPLAGGPPLHSQVCGHITYPVILSLQTEETLPRTDEKNGPPVNGPPMKCCSNQHK